MRKTRDSDEFLTDQAIADLAKKVLGDIYFDPFGHAKQLVRVRVMQTRATGNQPWPAHGPFWANIPFSQSAEQLPRLASWLTEHKIEGLVLCLAATGSNYWREAVWSKSGPQRIAWLPRISFMCYDERSEITEYWKGDRPVKPSRVRQLERTGQHEKLAQIERRVVKNPAFNTVAPTEHTISFDTALLLWSSNPVVINRFVREVTAYAREQKPGAPDIGISLGGGTQP